MESSDNNYNLGSASNWRDTNEDGAILFNGVLPKMKEQAADALKKDKDDKFELSEANVIKNFKSPDKGDIFTSKLYYYPAKNSCYKVLEIKRGDDDSIVSTKLSRHSDGEELVLKDIKEISTLRDYVNINIEIFTGNSANDIVNAPVRLQTKLEIELADPLEGATGKTCAMFKFFMDSVAVDKEKFLSSITDAKDDITILATTGFGKPKVFKRFHKPYEYPYWGYYGTNPDCIAFVPSQTVILAGFTLYGTDQPAFECKYKIYVDDNVVEEEDTFTCSDFEDKFYFRIKLKEFHEIKAGSKLEIYCNIAKNVASNEYISCYYGEGGSDWAAVENEDMGLWTVEASSKSQSSSVGYGNFPEIMYYV